MLNIPPLPITDYNHPLIQNLPPRLKELQQLVWEESWKEWREHQLSINRKAPESLSAGITEGGQGGSTTEGGDELREPYRAFCERSESSELKTEKTSGEVFTQRLFEGKVGRLERAHRLREARRRKRGRSPLQKGKNHYNTKKKKQKELLKREWKRLDQLRRENLLLRWNVQYRNWRVKKIPYVWTFEEYEWIHLGMIVTKEGLVLTLREFLTEGGTISLQRVDKSKPLSLTNFWVREGIPGRWLGGRVLMDSRWMEEVGMGIPNLRPGIQTGADTL